MTKTTIWKIANNNKMFRFSTNTRITIVVIGVALIVSMITINGIPKVAALDQNIQAVKFLYLLTKFGTPSLTLALTQHGIRLIV
jgi:hypothetical protein